MKRSMSLAAEYGQGTLTASRVPEKAFKQGQTSDGSRCSAVLVGEVWIKCQLHRISFILLPPGTILRCE